MMEVFDEKEKAKSEACMKEIKEVLVKYNAVFIFIKQEWYDSVSSNSMWDWGVKILPPKVENVEEVKES